MPLTLGTLCGYVEGGLRVQAFEEPCPGSGSHTLCVCSSCPLLGSHRGFGAELREAGLCAGSGTLALPVALCARHPIYAQPVSSPGAAHERNGVGVPASSLQCPVFLLNKGFRFQETHCPSLAPPLLAPVRDCRGLPQCSMAVLVLTATLPL